jgi:hypothetical protein
MAFIYYDQAFLQILKVDESHNHIFYLPISSALDVAFIDQNTAAVTSSTEKFITLVDLNTGETVKLINTNTTCSGITSINGMLVFCAIYDDID